MSNICCGNELGCELPLFSWAALGRDFDSFEKYHVFLIDDPAVGVADS